MKTRTFEIRGIKEGPHIQKSALIAYKYLVKKSANNRVSINKDDLAEIAKTNDYGFNTINGAICDLKNLGYIEQTGITSSHKRNKHLKFKVGSREYRKSTYIKYVYGITMEDLDSLYEKQNYKCAICGVGEKYVKKLHIDHNHSTGKVRGLLCFHCNAGLGHFRDSTDYLKVAINYLG